MAHTFPCGIKVGVGRIDCDVLFDCFYHDSLGSGAPCHLFKPFEKQRVVRDDKVAVTFNSLIDHIFSHVKAEEGRR